jgi:hypothetical protein
VIQSTTAARSGGPSYFVFSRCLALNKSIAQRRRIMGWGTHANSNCVALSDRDLSGL